MLQRLAPPILSTYMEKVRKAKNVNGPSYLHILSVCPTGWRIPTETAIEYGRLAVRSGAFPLYEVENGHYRITQKVDTLLPISEYLKGQGRFRHLTDDTIESIQKRITAEWEELKKLSEMK